MDTNTFIRHMAKLINESQDIWEDDEEFKEKNELEIDVEKDEDDEDDKKTELKVVKKVEKVDDEGCDEEVVSEVMSIDDILNQHKDKQEHPEKYADAPSNKNRKVVVQFKLDDVWVNGSKVTAKKLKDMTNALSKPPASPDDIPDDPDVDFDPDEELPDAPPEVPVDGNADFETGGAFPIVPGDKVEVSGSVKYKDGTVDTLDKVEIQGPKAQDAVMKELDWLNEQPMIKKGVCEYYAVLSLMLKNVVKDADDLASAQNKMFDIMNKDPTFEDIPDETLASDDDEDEEHGEENAGDFRSAGLWGKSRFGDVGAAYDDDFQQKDPKGDFYGESVGNSFVKWALMG